MRYIFIVFFLVSFGSVSMAGVGDVYYCGIKNYFELRDTKTYTKSKCCGYVKDKTFTFKIGKDGLPVFPDDFADPRMCDGGHPCNPASYEKDLIFIHLGVGNHPFSVFRKIKKNKNTKYHTYQNSEYWTYGYMTPNTNEYCNDCFTLYVIDNTGSFKPINHLIEFDGKYFNVEKDSNHHLLEERYDRRHYRSFMTSVCHKF